MAITVVTPASSSNLALLADVKELLGISGSSEDDLLNDMIAYSTAMIEDYLGYKPGLATVDETLAGNGRQELMLSRFPVASITSITLDSTTVDSDDYDLQEPEAGIVFKETCWAYTGKKYRYTARYQYGYTLPEDGSPTLPLSIQNAATILVTNLYNNKGVDTSLESEKFPDVYEVVYGKSRGTNVINRFLSPEIKSLLDPYVKRRM